MRIQPEACVVRLSDGERISEDLAAALDPVNIASIHCFRISPDRPTEMHFHDYDEYWLFTSGQTVATLRLEDGSLQEFQVEPSTLIVTPRGVEHGHAPRTEVGGYEWRSVIRPEARKGHLQR